MCVAGLYSLWVKWTTRIGKRGEQNFVRLSSVLFFGLRSLYSFRIAFGGVLSLFGDEDCPTITVVVMENKVETKVTKDPENQGKAEARRNGA